MVYVHQAWIDKLNKDVACCGDGMRELKKNQMPAGVSAEWAKTMQCHHDALSQLRKAMQVIHAAGVNDEDCDDSEIQNCESVVRAFKVDFKILRGNMKQYERQGKK